MDRTIELKKAAVVLGEKLGKANALTALVRAGFSVSFSEKILGGRYTAELRARKAATLSKILSRNGIEVSEEAS